MDDEELDRLVDLAANADKLAGKGALAEIVGRLLKPKRLTAKAVTALATALIREIEADRETQFLFPEAQRPKRAAGRPKGSVKKESLASALRLYGEANGLVAPERRASSVRKLQRVRADLRGGPGSPGRPKKPVNK